MASKQWILVFKRVILVGLTALTFIVVSFSLIQSWSEPQISSRLELYQTNLILHAAEWQTESSTVVQNDSQRSPDLTKARNALIGDRPIQTAQKQYQEARQVAQKSLEKTQKQLQQLEAVSATPPSETTPDLPIPLVSKTPDTAQLKKTLLLSIAELEKLINELDLRLGLLQADQGETKPALQTWTQLINRTAAQADDKPLKQTAAVLVGLWSDPPRLQPDADKQIQTNLDSWFRYRSLTQLYKLQPRPDALAALQTQEQKIAQQAILKLGIVTGLPVIGCLLGVGLLIFMVVQLLIQGKRSLLAHNANTPWLTLWDAETIWQVFILGFFFPAQILFPTLLPVVFDLLAIDPSSFDVRAKAFYVLGSYLLMSGVGLYVLYLSIKPFFPLPEGWFRIPVKDRWFLWGWGGYFVALPLVILVSVINQKLWQGQGGSNPILPIALEGRDGAALLIFFLTASVAAPIFEEVMFRGFLLPSLTRYLPVWAAISLSGFLFAIAHLSLSEVLPLMTLGILLGVVYTRSRNLLASILLHSLWNSGTLLSLFILGSGSR